MRALRGAIAIALLASIVTVVPGSLAGASAPGPLTNEQIERLHDVLAWEIEYTFDHSRTESGSGTHGDLGCCWAYTGPMTGWTHEYSDSERISAYLTVRSEGGADCTQAVQCYHDLDFPAGTDLSLERRAHDTYSWGPRADGSTCAPGWTDWRSDWTITSSTEGRDSLGKARFWIDYKTNPPAAELVLWATAEGPLTREAEGCMDGSWGSEGAWVYDRLFRAGFSPGSDTEYQTGDTSVREENGNLVIRGTSLYTWSGRSKRFCTSGYETYCREPENVSGTIRAAASWTARAIEPTLVVGASDGVEPAVEGTTLAVRALQGPNCTAATCTYAWFRSRGKVDGDYERLTHTGTTLNLAANGMADPGHRFKLEVTDSRGLTARSNVVAVGALQPRPAYPEAGEIVRVQEPTFNLNYAERDFSHEELGDYGYEIQVATSPSFEQSAVLRTESLAERTNSAFTTWRHPLEPGKTYSWRSRSVVGGAPGRWTLPREFTIAAAPWSQDGIGTDRWHKPADDADLAGVPLTGSFKEGYFHAGSLGTRLHGAMDIGLSGQRVRAVGSGILIDRVPGEGLIRVLHPESGLATEYRHMSHLTSLEIGVYLSQGTELGTAAAVNTNQAHLHFGVARVDGAWQTVGYVNPQRYLPWHDTTAPVIEGLELRRVDPAAGGGAHRWTDTPEAGRRAITGRVDVIARVRDPRPGGVGLAPYRTTFTVNGATGREIRFDELTETEHERDYYAYNTRAHALSRTASTGALAYPSYFMYFRWDLTGLTDDAGPQTLRIEAADFQGNLAPHHEIVIGPELDAPARVDLEGCLPQTVNVRVNNRNSNLEAAIPSDTYTVQVTRADGTLVGLAEPQLQIYNGDYADVPITLVGDEGAVRVEVSSGIVNDIRDAAEIEVHSDCLLNQPAPAIPAGRSSLETK